MNVNEFYEKLKEYYPDSLRCDWDNDGLMSSPGGVREVSRVLVALDATEEAINYAAQNDFDTVLVHHPLIFSPLRSVTPAGGVARKVIFSLMNDISVISLHTRLDAGEGGVNDCLAAALGLEGIEPFGTDEEGFIGRIGTLGGEMPVERFAEHVKEKLSASAVMLSAKGDEIVRRVAVLGGGGKDFIAAAKDAGADVLVTGEAPYNDMLDAAEDGIPVIAAGHYNTEFPVTARLASLAKSISGAECEIFSYTPVKRI